MPQPLRWDIFGRIVDNYGDAGVCWRLARQLAAEHAQDVTLWQDDLGALAGRAASTRRESSSRGARPALSEPPGCAADTSSGVRLAAGEYVPHDAGDLPPAWFILEYLSAEAWVDGAHGLASPHPRLPLPRRFWFPGFTSRTGGLIREQGLLAARDAFRRDAAAQAALWSLLRVPPVSTGEIRVSLFCYPNPALPALFDAWTDGDEPVVCLLPDGVASGALDSWTGGDVPHPGHPIRRGRLSIYAVPFAAQDDYDRLLWLSTVNFVRGEDSFVRAQWAGRPFVWHIYPQAEGAHWPKLDASWTSTWVWPRSGIVAPAILAGLERGAGHRPDRRPGRISGRPRQLRNADAGLRSLPCPIHRRAGQGRAMRYTSFPNQPLIAIQVQ
jgi:hypothetical protein